MFSLICFWINGWVNNGEAGDLRRHRGHYDVHVMSMCLLPPYCSNLMCPFMPRRKKLIILCASECAKSLTHWGRVMHIYVTELGHRRSGNHLSPSRHQTITWTKTDFTSIGHLWTNFSDTLFESQTFSLTKMHFDMSSVKYRQSCLSHSIDNIQLDMFLFKVSVAVDDLCNIFGSDDVIQNGLRDNSSINLIFWVFTDE